MGLRIAVVSSSLAAVFAATSIATAAPPPITIAVEAPLSGSQSSNGIDMLRGVELAVTQANAHGGVLRRSVRIVKVDDKGDQANARPAVRTVVAAKAVAVVGPYNSSVGIINLPLYVRDKVVPIHLTSSDDTRALGVTIQPKNSQIAPVEERYVRSLGVKRVAMLVDDTANGAFTIGMATRLRDRLAADGTQVSWIPIQEVANVPEGYYAAKVAEALAGSPDLLYSSTYYPEGVKIAQALTAAVTGPRCLMGLANVDPAFVATAGLTASRRCLFSGVPQAPQLPSAGRFVRQYRAAFHRDPGVWGVFTYDSTRLLLSAMRRQRTTAFRPLLRALRHVRGYTGATGRITIDPATGYRVSLPFLSILAVDGDGHFVFSP